MGKQSRLRAEKIARVQRERDIAEVCDYLFPFPCINSDWYKGQPIINFPLDSTNTGISFQLKEDDGITSDYREDISSPFEDFFIYIPGPDNFDTPYLLQVLQKEQSEAGSYNVVFHLPVDNVPPLGIMVWYKIDEGKRHFHAGRAGRDFYWQFASDRNFEDTPSKEGGFEMITTILQAAFTVFRLLNTNNIELVDQPPKPRLSEIHEREFGRPLTTYKVLKVNTSHKQYRGSMQETGLQDFDPRRMHVVRGHHAEYGTNGRGLHFGKYERKIWIPAHVRGNEELGIVVKDYEVVAGNN